MKVEPVPFWERARGRGPITTWSTRHAWSRQREALRQRILDDPTLLDGGADADDVVSLRAPVDRPPKPERRTRLPYRVARERCLCIDCNAPSEGFARCAPCRDRVNARRSCGGFAR